MSLSAYIKTIGNSAAAKLFDVSEGTAKSWRYGYRKPSADNAKEIVRITDGRVTWEGIYATDRKTKHNC